MSFGAHIPELQLEKAQAIAALKASGIQPDDLLIELGSGEGGNLLVAARDFKARARGVEILPYAAEYALERAEESGVAIEIDIGDLMDYNPADADYLLMYLGPAFHDVLAPRLERTLRPDATVIACGWQVPGWWEIDVDESNPFDGYVYRPSDPNRQLSWIREQEQFAVSAGSRFCCEIIGVSHADLDACIPRLSHSENTWKLEAEIDLITPRRGQGISIQIFGTAPEDSETMSLELSVLAETDQSPLIQRGPSIPINIQAT